jgi:hypothetical protein
VLLCLFELSVRVSSFVFRVARPESAEAQLETDGRHGAAPYLSAPYLSASPLFEFRVSVARPESAEAQLETDAMVLFLT